MSGKFINFLALFISCLTYEDLVASFIVYLGTNASLALHFKSEFHVLICGQFFNHGLLQGSPNYVALSKPHNLVYKYSGITLPIITEHKPLLYQPSFCILRWSQIKSNSLCSFAVWCLVLGRM